MDMLILIGGFCILCLLGMPVAYALGLAAIFAALWICLLYTSPSPRDA